jgi:hypothetical protein
MPGGSQTRRGEALELASSLLADIELGRSSPTDVVRRTSRLARLLDDQEAMTWLAHEIRGYRPDPGGGLNPSVLTAAERSGRVTYRDDGSSVYLPLSVGAMQANIDAAMAQIANPITPAGAGVSYRTSVRDTREALDAVIGAMHDYASTIYQELRFGTAVESAFDRVREAVDGQIARLVPGALPTVTTAFENAASPDPEQWRNAAAACRTLLKACADALEPPGPDRAHRKMGEEQYINRLVAWIEERGQSDTATEFAIADLEYLGRRLDASVGAGHKGAHAAVGQVEAARFVAGTYLVLGDVLALATIRDDWPPK